jgi:hypothetical protein
MVSFDIFLKFWVIMVLINHQKNIHRYICINVDRCVINKSQIEDLRGVNWVSKKVKLNFWGFWC